jgi:hypothetical protein
MSILSVWLRVGRIPRIIGSFPVVLSLLVSSSFPFFPPSSIGSAFSSSSALPPEAYYSRRLKRDLLSL